MLSCILNQTCCTRGWFYFCPALIQSFWDQCYVSSGKTDRNCRSTQQCGHTWYVFQILGTIPLLQSWPRSGSVTSSLILLYPSWIWILLKKVFSSQRFPAKAVFWNSKLRLWQFMISTSTTLNKQASTLFMYNRKGKKISAYFIWFFIFSQSYYAH